LKKFAASGMPNKNRPRIVVDTNILISAAIVPNSAPDKLIKAWQKKQFILLTPSEQLEEIKDVSERKRFEIYELFKERVEELIETLGFAAERIHPVSIKDIPIHCRDPKDDFLLATALGGNADYLITGDKDLLVLNGNPALDKLKIISVSEFLNLL